jgi:uncharacterized protein YutE (UPF0331/DUF86 family)
MTFLIERLGELRGHVDHVRELAPRLTDRSVLEADRALRNDVLFSLLMIAQLVIDISSELAARRGERFEDYREAIRTLGRDGRFPADLVAELEQLPGFRNVVVHEYLALNLDRAIDAVRRIEPIERFIAIVAELESSDGDV